MSLRAFISDNRDELLASCARKLKREEPERAEAELGEQLRPVIDEIVGALAREEGLPVTSPLPGKSSFALQHGRRRKQWGSAIDRIARDFGSISDSVGELAISRGASFDARDYRVLNLCIDSAIGAALESYWEEAHEQETRATTERIGYLVHELRNALASAQMAFAMLQREHMSVTSRTGTVLGRGLSRAEALIGQALLDVQLRAGIKAEPKRLQVAELLKDVEDSMILEREIRLVVEIEEALEAEADERLLNGAIHNLLQNAVKFSRRGGTIVLRAHRDRDGVLIEVEDECGGLREGVEEELFEPFVQRGSDRRGIGLGLSITREAIQAHGGELSVRNLPGKGCVFAVRIPA